MVNGNNTLLFYYDESGSPTSFSHNGTMYFYIKNLQGDICKIVDTSGSVIANYTYDAWGKLLSVKDSAGNSITSSSNIALLNPLRYRGYVYDDETGLYYLQSRYYDPTIDRFINADILFDTESGSPLSTNMFAYCENNTLLVADYYGNRYKYIGNHIYEVDNQSNYNCYAYALGYMNKIINPGYTSFLYSLSRQLKKSPFTISDVYKQVKNDLNRLKIQFRSSTSNTKLKKGEYRIAMRVINIRYKNKYGEYCTVYDFHFMKQNPSNGHWWQKHGKLYVENIGKVDLNNTKNWIIIKPKIYYNNKKYGLPYLKQDFVFDFATGKNIYLYYNSVTKYLIIKKKFWSVL